MIAFEAVFYALNYAHPKDTKENSTVFIAKTDKGAVFMAKSALIDHLKIYNQLGECLAEVQVNGSPTVNLNQYVSANGLYLISFSENGEDHVLKAIIQ